MMITVHIFVDINAILKDDEMQLVSWHMYHEKTRFKLSYI